jgi:hypothetical protein
MPTRLDRYGNPQQVKQDPIRYVVRVKDDDAPRGYRAYQVVAMNAADAKRITLLHHAKIVGQPERVNRAAGEQVGMRGVIR